MSIRGAGGGGGKGGGGSARVAVEDPDTLRSKQYARVLDLIGEGEIEGFVNVDPAKSIYFDETPLRSADGTLNFKGASVDWRYGSQDQTYIPGFEDQEAEVGVGVLVLAATPVTRQITNAEVEVARVTVSVPALTHQNTTNGDLHGSSVQLAIDVQPNGGSFTAVDLGAAGTISGKTRSKYQRSFRIPLTGSAPWNIRVRRLTADSATASVQNELYWESYTEITPVKMTYPNSALVGIRIDSSQFNSIPTRAYHMRLLRVRVPTNYNPDTRSYSGVWNGTFKVAWTNNPAWCYYDMVTNTRYGLGQHIPEAITDKWTLYEIGKYCDQLVPNGLGGSEPRFALNVYMQERGEAYKVMNDLASAFRGMVYWSTGALFAVQDAPSDPVAIFNATNVINGDFSREGSGRKARHTAAVVQWNDPNDFYRLRPEYVEDAAGIARYGVRKAEVVAFGTTSQGQAHRVGKWILYTERYESEVVSFRTGLDAAYVRPGQIVMIVDPGRSASRYGGRVLSATSNSVTVDAPVAVEAGVNELSLILPDGTVANRTLTNTTGSHTVLTFAAALAETDLSQAIWVVGTPSIEPELIRVLSISEQSDNTYTIVGVAHYPAKYAAIEQETVLQVPPVSNLRLAPDPVENLTGSEYLYISSGSISTRLVVSFDPSALAATYQVSYRRQDGGNWVKLPVTSSTHVEVDDVVPATYDIDVIALNGLGKGSQSATATYTVLGKAGIPPSDVASITATPDRDSILLEWPEIGDLDRKDYDLRLGATWGTSTPVGIFASTALRLPPLPTGSYTWHIKARDTSLNLSENSASVTLVIADPAAVAVTASLVGPDVRLTWPEPATQFTIANYELRYGANWAAGAATAVTLNSSSYQVPVNYLGVRKYMVAALDSAGNIGAIGEAEVTISAPSAPAPLQSQVVDNNVLLFWGAAAGSLPVATYELRRGSTWAGAEVLGTKSGGFTSVFETASGSYTYWVAGIDTAGNYGTPASVTVAVSQPPDYVLRSDIESTLSGTLVSARMTVEGHILLPVNITETFAEHFIDNVWDTPQEQIDGGFPVYIQPAMASGYYEELVDYGAVLPATRLSLILTGVIVSGTPVVTTRISVSTDGVSYTDYDDVDQVFASGVRYAKYRVTVASTGGDDLYKITNLQYKLDAKLINDAGNVSCLASDTGGTEVFFNVPFLDVESITVTPKATYAVSVAYDFVDTPYPTSFKILLFNSITGARVSLDASWAAKGN